MFKTLILLSIVSYIDLKAVQYDDDPYRGYYDHMYDHMHLRETPGVLPDNNYEAKYIPQVDGNPIYVPPYVPSYHEQTRDHQYEQYQADQHQQYLASQYQHPMPLAPKQDTPNYLQTMHQNPQIIDSSENHLAQPHFVDTEISQANFPGIEEEPVQETDISGFTKFHKKPKPMPKPQTFPVKIEPEIPQPYPEIFEKPVLKEKVIVKKVGKPEKYSPKQKHVPSKDKISDNIDNSDYMDYEYDQPQVIDAKLKEKLRMEENNLNNKNHKHTVEKFNAPEIQFSHKHKAASHKHKVSSKPKDKTKVHVPHKPKKPQIHKPIKHHSVIKVQKYNYESVSKTSEKPAQTLPIIKDDEYEPVVVVESLIKKPIQNDQSKDEWDSPVIVEALTKRKPTKHASVEIKDSIKQKVYSKPIYESNESLKVPEFFSVEERHKEKLPPKETPIDIDLENADKTQDIGTISTENKGMESQENYGDSRNFMKSNIWSMMSSFHSQERNKFKKCLTPDHEPGNCMPIQICPVPNFQLTLDDLMQKVCSIDDVFIGICCPEFPAETLKVKWDNITEAPSQPEAMNNEENKPVLECGVLKNSEKLNSWPWMAPLISASTRRIFCGGVLVHNQYVLTAAHCTRKIPHNQILVILGAMTSQQDPTNQEFEVIEIKRHAQYNPRTMQNDIALLKLSRPVDIGEQKRFICLPSDEKSEGKTALMLGWQGSFAASKNEEFLNVISTDECKRGVKMSVSASILCTEPRTEDSMCNLDSGAPLVIEENGKYEVIGVLTWNRNDCDSSFPSVFTRVSHFRKWIENHLS